MVAPTVRNMIDGRSVAIAERKPGPKIAPRPLTGGVQRRVLGVHIRVHIRTDDDAN